MKQEDIAKVRVRIRRCAKARGTGHIHLSKENCEALCYLWDEKPDAFVSRDRVRTIGLYLTSGKMIELGQKMPGAGQGGVELIDVIPSRGGARVSFKVIGDHSKYMLTVRETAITAVVTRED